MNKMILKDGSEMEILSFTENVTFEGVRDNAIQVHLPATDIVSQIAYQREVLTNDNVELITFEVDDKVDIREFVNVIASVFIITDTESSYDIILRKR